MGHLGSIRSVWVIRVIGVRIKNPTLGQCENNQRENDDGLEDEPPTPKRVIKRRHDRGCRFLHRNNEGRRPIQGLGKCGPGQSLAIDGR